VSNVQEFVDAIVLIVWER